MKRILIISTLAVLFIPLTLYAAIINIPADYSTIQQGIDASSDGDTVLVQPGTYVENINFNGHNIVLGSLFLTTGDTSYVEQTVIDGDYAGSVVRFWGNEDSTAILSGFTIQNGLAEYGGGITCYHSTPEILNNVIKLNEATEGGGGIDCYIANPSIIGNSIIENSSGFTGGGVYCNGASPLILDNSIKDNWTRSHGGGIYCRFNSNASIIENDIMGNYGYSGAGIYITLSDPIIDGNRISSNDGGNHAKGGGIYCVDSQADIKNNRIDRNTARTGGGIYVDGDLGAMIENNIIYLNITYKSGAGIYCGSDASIINNTITGNISGNGGGGIVNWYSAPTVKNNIFWGNVADFSYQIYAIGNPIPLVTFCDVQGGWAGQGNIDENPLFVNSAGDNYNICLGSPCIDAGDPDLLDPDSTRSDIGVFYEDHPECHTGNTWYVSISGNDTTGDGSQGNPYRTIQHAIDISNHRDSVIVDNGIYEENIDFTGKRIVVASNFIFSNDTLDIHNTVIKGDSVSATVTMVSGEDSMTTIIGFTIRDGGDSGVKCNNSDPNIIHN
ncbi:MAG: right-handed parallel beta-helix repeat-containing protein [Candidatus Zixiibacteriota bacterium]|nr:MAG: right-handed parallel beta-helix repeat-containing protein [candidate division Zixibacteria bacterium]